MRFTHGSALYLPPELLSHVFSFIDDLDIRRYFKLIGRLTSDRYDAVKRVVRRAYVQWQCDAVCPPNCSKHRYPLQFNAITTPTYTGVGSPPAWRLPPSLNPKASGPWQHFSLCFRLLNGSDRVKRERSSDLILATIVQYEHCVTYDVGMWIVKKRTGEHPHENNGMYVSAELSSKEYFTDYHQWKFDVE